MEPNQDPGQLPKKFFPERGFPTGSIGQAGPPARSWSSPSQSVGGLVLAGGSSSGLGGASAPAPPNSPTARGEQTREGGGHHVLFVDADHTGSPKTPTRERSMTSPLALSPETPLEKAQREIADLQGDNARLRYTSVSFSGAVSSRGIQ